MNRHLESADNDSSDQELIVRILVVVKTASSHRHEIAGFTHLAGLQQPNLIDLGAEIVVRVWIRRHLVAPGIVVDEEDASAWRDDEFGRPHRAARRNRDAVRVVGR
jgi:hypothetical protein